MKEGESEKVFKVIIMAENAPNLEKTWLIDSRSWVNLKQNKPKETHAKTHRGQTLENWRQRKKILKETRKKWHLIYRRKTIWMTIWVLRRNLGGQNKTAYFSSVKKKKIQNFLSKENVLPKWKDTQDLSDEGKLREVFARRPTLKEWLNEVH